MTSPSTDDHPGRGLEPAARLTLRTPVDALAAVPVILGFEPQESLVMITFGGRETFHARIDLPPPDDLVDLDHVVDQLVEPAVAHEVVSVLLIVYAADRGRAETAELTATFGFEAAGITVTASVVSDGSRWWAPGWPGHEGMPDDGTPCQTTGHRFRAESVVRGQVVHGSRAELAALLDPVPAAVARVRDARRRGRTTDAAGVSALVARGAQAGRLDDDDLVTLLFGLRRTNGRDAAWAELTRAEAGRRVHFWVDVVQRCPADLVTAPAAVLALTAWLAGHGALAWCAVDRCQAIDPRHSLARLVRDLLVTAASPSVWEELWVRRHGVDDRHEPELDQVGGA